jgi:2-oxoglutarate ferredoxin oxidoreductase subunit alpha
VQELESATVRLAGDAGDGIQLVGARFTLASSVCGNDVRTLPDLPAEIRAPAGSLAGVSAFQLHFGAGPVRTSGDRLDTLIAFNPAALKRHLPDLAPGGLLIVNRDAFGAAELRRAAYTAHPLEDGSLSAYRLLSLPLTTLNREAVAALKLTPREADRCKNFFALGLLCWLYDRPTAPTLTWIADKFSGNPAVEEANRRSFLAGHRFGETTDLLPVRYRVPPRPPPPGRYRRLTGNEALALGLVAAARRANLPLFFAAYPIAPVSEVLHRLAALPHFGVRAVQTEDEIAAVCAALGASFGGALAATATSGPGLCLKSEALGLAVMTELPLVVIDVQRGGPSLGLPTRTEQTDLFLALHGRHGECPLVVLAASSPADCFDIVLEAARLAVGHMTPVLVLSDAYLAGCAEPWRVPDVAALPTIPVRQATEPNGQRDGQPVFLPYARDERLVRPWAVPGTPGLEHCIGGLEKQNGTGQVSFEGVDHAQMVRLRAEKIARIAADIAPLTVDGPESGELLVLGWGGTAGALTAATERCRQRGRSVAHAHLRHLNPLPPNLGDVLRRYRRVLVPELNAGQLLSLIRATFTVEGVGLNKMEGRPFLVGEVEAKIEEMLGPGVKA